MKAGGLSVMTSDRDCHIVHALTAMIGTEKASIVVAKALHLNGAMIASAERNPDGSFTDHGHLTLRVGELFIQHIYGYDDGNTIGAALNFLDGGRFKPTFGAHDKEATTKATIGQGDIEVTNGAIPEGLNRDVNDHTETHTNFDLKPITMYFTGYDADKALDQIRQGGIEGVASNIWQAIAKPFADLLLSNTASLDQSQSYIEIEQAIDKIDANEEEKAKIRAAYEIGIENGLAPEAALYAAMMLNPIHSTTTDENGNKKIRIDITEDNKMGTASLAVVQEYYGDYFKIPESAHKLLKDNYAYMEDGNLKYKPISEVEKEAVYHKYMVELASKADDMLYITKKLNEKYGTATNIALTAINMMVVGPVMAAISYLKGEAFAKIFGEAIKQGFEYGLEKGSENIQKADQYLSKGDAKKILTALGVTIGAVLLGKEFKDLYDYRTIGKHIFKGDARIDNTVSPAAKELLDNVRINENMSAAVLNRKISQYYEKPPFYKATKVGIFEYENNMDGKFVRLYNVYESNPNKGQFLALRKDVFDTNDKILSPSMLKDKFDLPHPPTHMSEALPEAGTKIAIGIVEEGNYGGKGKGTQFFFMKEAKEEWFLKGKDINEFK